MGDKTRLLAMMGMTGVTQGMLADMLGVRDRSVRRWISPTYPQYKPSKAAFELLDGLLEKQRAYVDMVVSDPNHRTELHYWRSQEEHDRATACIEDYRIANANSVAAAQVLAQQGILPVWSAPTTTA